MLGRSLSKIMGVTKPPRVASMARASARYRRANPPHGTIVREMEVMVENGLTPMMAIESATRQAAELTGTIDAVGTIETGKLADMILVDPLYEVGAIRNAWAVFQGGRRIR